MFEFYLQKGDDTSVTFKLDKVSDINLDLPGSDYKLIDNIGVGSQIDGTGFLKGRKMVCQYQFRSNDHYERDEFLDWFTKSINSTYYLYRTTKIRLRGTLTNGSSEFDPDIYKSFYSTTYFESFKRLVDFKDVPISDGTVGVSSGSNIVDYSSDTLYIDNVATVSIANAEIEVEKFFGRIKVYPALTGGEMWKAYRLSDNVKFNMYSKTPYFTSTTLFSTSIDITTTSEESATLNLYSHQTPCIYDFQSTSQNFTTYQVRNYNGFGFRASGSFNNTTSIIVKTMGSDLTLTVDSTEQSPSAFYPTSSPFMLENGDNTLYTIASSGLLVVSWYERRL